MTEDAVDGNSSHFSYSKGKPSFKHSKCFEVLKKQKEALLDNYSSSQYIEVWDELLYKAIEPIFLYTDYANEVLAEIFHHTVNNFKRKISTVSKEHLVYGLFLFNTVSRDQRIDVYKQMRLERTITKYIIKSFLSSLESYQDLLKQRITKNNLKSRELEDQIKLVKGSEETKPLLIVTQEVEFYNKEASSFKSKIMEKHTRNIIMEAQRHYKFCNFKVELDTIVQTMYQFASYAVDKYDSANGTLTSYIGNWLQHARGHVMSQELTSSYSKDKPFVHIESIDDYYEVLSNESDDDQIEKEMEVSRVRLLAKMVDPTGLGRLSLDIQETLNTRELSLLLQAASKSKKASDSKPVK